MDKQTPVVVLGRDMMGDGTEPDFARWVAFVAKNIARASGVAAAVMPAAAEHGLQEDRVDAVDPGHEEALLDGVAVLWEEFCVAEPAVAGRIR